MKMSLERRIIFFAFIILFLTILANTGMDIVGFRKDYITALVLRSQSLGSSMKGGIEKVLGLGLDLKELTGISEKCRELVEGNPEIAYCVINDMDGTIRFANDPAYLTLPINKVNASFVMNHDHQVNIIGDGIRYYDSATPVISPYGKVVANVHVGFRQKAITDKVARMILRSVVILLIFFLLSFSLVVFFVKKGIIQPISILLAGVKKITEGSFDINLEKMPIYEFNRLAETINFMSTSLKNREEEIKKNYHELEGAHNDLHDSYLKLESLSMELEKSEELYKSLMEDSSDAIVVIGGAERVMMVNKKAEEFFGYTAEEIVGLPLTKLLLLLSVENIPKIHKIFNDALKGAHVVDEMDFTNKEGATVFGRIYASCITSGERLVQVIFQDITREREIVKNLEKSAADLARLNKMKDSFLGVASHELKTPLTVIMGYAELLSTDMADQIDTTALEMVQHISNAAFRLDNIVKDMVDVTMIDERKLQLKLEEIDVNQLVQSAVSELRFFFSMRKQELVINLDESIPLIKGDTLRLVQLLTNIFGNAIKFTPDGGKITISTGVQYLLRSRQLIISSQPQPLVNIGKERHVYVELIISDTGIGIDRDDQLRIFEKFYEVGNIEEHSSGKIAFKAKGAGLGLAIAKGIVEMHGGEIWVESKGYNAVTYPGSTFHILFPLDPLLGDATLDYMNLLR